ncbi:MAG: MATE family efflux transporter [Chloroflexota bacterium]
MEETRVSARRGAAFTRDWTKGNIFHNLLSLSWPMIMSNSLNMLGPTVDMIWVGKLGAAAIAGVGVAGMIVMLVNSMLMGLFMGLRAMVARSIGAGDEKSAVHVAKQAIVISTAFSIFTAVIGIFFAEPIMRLLGVEADVITQGAPYLRINFVGMVAMSFRMMTDTTMQASGDSMNPMKIAVVFRFFHIALCPFLVFGWWFFPQMGVSGAAITNVISQSLGTTIGLWILLTGRSRLRLVFSNFHLDFDVIWRLVKVGTPASVMGMERTLSGVIMMWFMVPFGTLAVAGHTLCQRIEMMLFVPVMGLGMGAGVLAGQNLGAHQPERAERGGWLAMGLAEGFMAVCSLAILLWAESIIRIFNANPELVALASTFLRIAVVGYLMMGFAGVLMSCISSAGDTLPPMLVSLLTGWLVQIPLAYFLPRATGLGVYGVRWAIVAAMVLGAVIYTIYFRLGKWKQKKV